MARAVSRKNSPKRSSGRLSSYRKCVAGKAKSMHKTATRRRSHQLALARANKTCAKMSRSKSSPKRISKKVKSRVAGKRMSGFMDKMKQSYAQAKEYATKKYQEMNSE